jgi:uncharacterized protein YigE (DUF2233 family)
MSRKHLLIIAFAALIFFGIISAFKTKHPDDRVLSYTVDTSKQSLKFYWQDDEGAPFKSIINLKNWLGGKHQNLLFATNGGMYNAGSRPVGLFVNENSLIVPLDTTSGNGNFYLKPNGVFFLTNSQKGVVCKTSDFKWKKNIKYATQSGPMLVINGEIHASFKGGSTNLNIRNGVGILPDNRILFAMSKEPINFYDFAKYFKDSGCKNALYLDGFVSRTYLPAQKWLQTDGDFGVIIGVTSN